MDSSGHLPPRPKVTLDQIVTVDDLRLFKEDLLKNIRIIVQEQPHPPPKKWLKTYEVLDLLGICPATLQELRDNGSIPYSPMGRVFYYDPDDVNRELERRKTIGRNRSNQFEKKSSHRK